MSLSAGLRRYGLLALVVPGIILLTGVSTLADASPSPSGAPLPGDPTSGQTVYLANCAVCHGANLEGGIGAALNPIDKLPGVPNSLDPAFLIAIISNGRQPQAGDPKQVAMPEWSSAGKLTAQQIKDVAAYIIQQNTLGAGNAPLSAGELAKRTIFFVAVGIVAMVFITYLLAQYNMRWIARRAAARRK